MKQVTGNLDTQGSDGVGIMPFGPDGPAVGSRAAFSGPVVGHGRSGRRGEKAPLCHQEPVRRNTEGGMMMKAAPSPAFIVPKAEFLLELFVVAFNTPAKFGQKDQRLQAALRRQIR